MIRTLVFDRCTTFAGISALIGLRCFSNLLPEKVVLPAISYIAPVSRDDSGYRTHDQAVVGRAVSRVQINAYDKTGDGAEALADQIVLGWSGHKNGCTIGYAFVANRISVFEESINMWREIVDVMVEHGVA